MYTPVYMAKLYWKVKINGKWTFRPAIIDTMNANFAIVHRLHPNPIEDEQ